MQIPDEVISDLRTRFRRVEGQVVAQLSAANKALEQVCFRLVASGLVSCLEHPEEASEAGYSLDEVQRLFTKLA